MLDKNFELLMDSVFTLPLAQVQVLCDATDEEGAYDFLGWVFESVEGSEEDLSEGVEGDEDVTDFLLSLAEHYEPSDASSNYQERLERRRDRYEALAAKRQAESSAAFDTSHRMGQAIPFGQPILVGHHSEGRDRRYRQRIWDLTGKSVKLAETAKYHAARAARVGKSGISADDPNKIIKLRVKMAQLDKLQRTMVAANKIVRSKRKAYSQDEKIADLVALGLTEKQAHELFVPDYGSRIGFPSYALSNNSAEIRRLRDRIAIELSNIAAVAQAQDKTYRLPDGMEVELVWDAGNNRVRFCFDGKPDADVRGVVKSNGFNWSRYNSAWQRKITANARYAVRQVIRELEMEEIDNG